MKIGIYQNYPEFGDIDKNIKKANEDLNSVDADLVVMPELFNTGYQFVSKEEAVEFIQARGLPDNSNIELAKRIFSPEREKNEFKSILQ